MQKADEREKSFGQNRNRTLHETFQPVIQAQTDMTEKIVKSLREMNPPPPARPQPGQVLKVKKRRLSETDQDDDQDDDYGPLAKAYKERYESRDDEIDVNFGIQFHDREPFIGVTPIKIEGDDIIIYGEVYTGTPGLWALITEKNKGNLDGKYDADDLKEYEGILSQTNALHQDNNPNSPYPKSSRSWKWKHILGPIWERWKNEDDELKHGSGILVKKLGCIWKAKRHSSGKRFRYRKLRDGVYLNGNLLYKL